VRVELTNELNCTGISAASRHFDLGPLDEYSTPGETIAQVIGKNRDLNPIHSRKGAR
jgi:hypothetical protein